MMRDARCAVRGAPSAPGGLASVLEGPPKQPIVSGSGIPKKPRKVEEKMTGTRERE